MLSDVTITGLTIVGCTSPLDSERVELPPARARTISGVQLDK